MRSTLRPMAGLAFTAGLVGSVLAPVLAPGTAHALVPARVSVTSSAHPQLVFTAGAGNLDRVSFRPYIGGVEIEDTLVAIVLDAADGGCTNVRADLVRCPASSGITGVIATLLDGDDSFVNKGSLPAVVNGGDGNDRLTGGSGVDELNGANGDDLVNGGDGEDDLNGGPGRDTLHGDGGNDTLEGGTGADDVYGDAGNDTLNSFFADDELFGGDGNDELVTSIDVHGGPGNDHITMTRNRGEYWGDEGFDTIDYSHWTWARVSLDGNDNDTGSATGDGRHNVHGDVDGIIGTPGDDDLVGHDGINRIEGGLGDDRLVGKDGDDTLDAGPGNNQEVDGGSGFDICLGFNITKRSGCDHF